MSPVSRTTARLAVLATAFVGLLTTASPLTAAAAPASATAAGSAPVMVVLDASGSMTTADAPGRRIDAAKRAVTGLVGNLPSDARVGLEVYGTSTGSAGSEKAAGCRDIKVLVPVGPVDSTSFVSRVDSVRASGYTPIGESLRRAAAALPREGSRSIVLVSDGEDTCAPPQPCEVARELKSQGTDLVVDTVGFKVDGAARAQLQCIAQATGGVYRDAPDGPSLADRLDEQVQRALRPYVPTGTPINGGTDASSAPQLQPGQYLDSYPKAPRGLNDPGGTAKTYRVSVHRGETPYVSATIVPPARPDRRSLLLTVAVKVEPIGGSDDFGCAVNASGSSVAPAGSLVAATAVARFGRIGGESCLGAGDALVTVTRTSPAYQGTALPVELAYRVEPEQDTSGVPTAAVAQKNVRAATTGAVRTVDSGTSFNTAPVVVPGAYTDTAVSGESRYVRVHLDWGQRLAYSVEVAAKPGTAVTDGVFGFTAIANPVREKVPDADGSRTGAPALGGANAQSLYGSTSAPARWTNRGSSDGQVRPLSLDGDYYLVLSAAFPTGNDAPTTVRYTLRVSVLGTPEAGPRLIAATPSSTSTSASASASHGTAGATSAQLSAAAARTGDGGLGTPAVVGGSVAVVALVGAAGLALTMRRRRNASGPSHGDWSAPRR